jgi:hypothetical protein
MTGILQNDDDRQCNSTTGMDAVPLASTARHGRRDKTVLDKHVRCSANKKTLFLVGPE